jgi:hypothetical protein
MITHIVPSAIPRRAARDADRPRRLRRGPRSRHCLGAPVPLYPLHQSLPITTATPVSIDQTSPGIIKAFENTRDCTARLAATFHQLVTYQPGSRYWPMQWCELTIFLSLSIVLGGFCFWWIRRPVI